MERVYKLALILASVAFALIVLSFSLPREFGLKMVSTVGVNGSGEGWTIIWLDTNDQVTVALPKLSNGTFSITGGGYNYTDVFWDTTSFTVLFKGSSGLYNISLVSEVPLDYFNVSVSGARFTWVHNLLAVAGLVMLAASPGSIFFYYLTKQYPDTKSDVVEGVAVTCRTKGYDRHECQLRLPASLDEGVKTRLRSALVDFYTHHNYVCTELTGDLIYARHRRGRNEVFINVGREVVTFQYRVRKFLAHGSRDLEWVFKEVRDVARATLGY
ncbi:hypothetical protein TCELL_0887 [Thermogladius calderae 1633]|uniref:Uncharacterized protein n=1 Tax=Thermogladius calderae (strain DSM 22663 / VKM B-2946 / 1633) TaxID=1184251 RepID=I3TEX3_THEC1|nr:hypothetical protein TCELL_0887 [Thermogladius calderae 1633]